MPHLKFLPKALKIVELALYPNYPLKESHKLSTIKKHKKIKTTRNWQPLQKGIYYSINKDMNFKQLIVSCNGAKLVDRN